MLSCVFQHTQMWDVTSAESVTAHESSMCCFWVGQPTSDKPRTPWTSMLASVESVCCGLERRLVKNPTDPLHWHEPRIPVTPDAEEAALAARTGMVASESSIAFSGCQRVEEHKSKVSKAHLQQNVPRVLLPC